MTTGKTIALTRWTFVGKVMYLLFNMLSRFGDSDGKKSAYNVGDPGSIPGSERSLEKEMTTQSDTLAWKIPWTDKPGRLQSMGSQRVRHD